MLIQKRVQTFAYDEVDCYVYAITNGDSVWIKPEGEVENVGLNIKFSSSITLAKWIKEICPCVHFDMISGHDNDTLSDEALAVILFDVLSGAENSTAGWKITSLELRPPHGLIMTLQNESINQMAGFLRDQMVEIKQITGVFPNLTSKLPGSYYNVFIDLAETEQKLSLYFDIAPSETDDCSYEVRLSKGGIMVTESNSKHWRRLHFHAPYKKDGHEYYKVETEEAMLH